LLVIATALGLGLLVGVPRTYLFERCLYLYVYKGERLPEDIYDQLASEAKLTAYRAAIDETYRYHQFFGGIAVALLFLYPSWLVHYRQDISLLLKLLSIFLFVIIECGIGFAAHDGYRIYMKRAKSILQKDT
jgi:hypothetical protein